MRLYLAILFLTMLKLSVKAQDTSGFFNKSIGKNAITGSVAGESLYFGVGYERKLIVRENYSLSFSCKVSPFLKSRGLVLPTGLVQEFFPNQNKLVCGIYLGNYFDPTSKRTNLQDVRSIEEDPSPLKTTVTFFYVPYGSITIGYKRYFTSKHSLSIYGNVVSYPYFATTSNPNKAKLNWKTFPFGGITYSYQF